MTVRSRCGAIRAAIVSCAARSMRLSAPLSILVVIALSSSPAGAQPTAPPEDEPVDLDAGGELGYARLDDTNYVAPTLAADLRLTILQAAIRIPLRFEASSGEVREKDWDETSDFFRVAQCTRIDFHSGGRFERERGLCQPWQVHPDDYYLSTRMGPLANVSL